MDDMTPAVSPAMVAYQRRLEGYVRSLVSELTNYMQEGFLSGTPSLIETLKGVASEGLIETPTVEMRIQGSYTRTFTFDTEIDVPIWFIGQAVENRGNTWLSREVQDFIKENLTDEIIEAADDEWDCSTSDLDIDELKLK
jgi:hypothetical protein